MRRMKVFLTITLLILVMGLGTPAAFADGNAESPGITTTTTEEITLDGNAEAPGVTGNAEAPGFMTTALIYLDIII